MNTTTPIPAFAVTRDHNGKLEAVSTFPLGERRELRITTDKGYKGLSCDAMVRQLSESGNSWTHAFSLSRFSKGDYSRTLVLDKAKRATEKSIATMHAAGLLRLDEVMAEVKAHYEVQAEHV
jgi:hypothetical protein